VAQQRVAQRVPTSGAGCGIGAATAAATAKEAAAGGCDWPGPKQAAAAADAGAEQDGDLASSSGQREPMAEQAAGPSSGTVHDADVYPGVAVKPHGRAERLRGGN
jgi:hypothetical protein